MGTMLFRSLHHRENPRGHPVLVALLRGFCYQALYWWRQGVEPEEPVHPHVLALDHISQGKRLGDVLREAGFSREFIAQEVGRYLNAVDQFRGQHTGIPAPETTPFFARVFRGIGPQGRFGMDRAAEVIGGWEHFYEYIRTHAFLFEDWATSMHMEPEKVRVEQQMVTIMSTAQRTPVYVPVWVWTDGHNVTVGILYQSPADLLLADLVQFFGRSDALPLPFPVWIMYPDRAEPHTPVLNSNALTALIRMSGTIPAQPPYPWPEGMYTGQCRVCGFRSLCWEAQKKPRTMFLFRDIEVDTGR